MWFIVAYNFCLITKQMELDSSRRETTQLLNDYYKTNTEDIPTQRMKSEWKAENNRGFLLGIVHNGQDSHIKELYCLFLKSNQSQFKEQEEFLNEIQTFIDNMFQYYIQPFHKYYCTSSQTPVSSRKSSKANLEEGLDYIPGKRELTHKDLKQAVSIRDGVCLFCWDSSECEVAHIIAQKNNIFTDFDESSLFQRAGLTQKHQVQNGLLLCQICQSI